MKVAVVVLGLAVLLNSPAAPSAMVDDEPYVVEVIGDLAADSADVADGDDSGPGDSADPVDAVPGDDEPAVADTGGIRCDHTLCWTARARITAYCTSGVMRSGRRTYVGAVATDRAYIPEGSLIEIEGLPGRYTSEDTGSGVRGWHVDIYMPSCADAVRWGSQQRAIRVMRWGW